MKYYYSFLYLLNMLHLWKLTNSTYILLQLKRRSMLVPGSYTHVKDQIFITYHCFCTIYLVHSKPWRKYPPVHRYHNHQLLHHPLTSPSSILHHACAPCSCLDHLVPYQMHNQISLHFCVCRHDVYPPPVVKCNSKRLIK